MAEPASIDRDLLRLEAELKRLEAEYNMYFSGRLAKPPAETRARVAALVRQYDHVSFPNYGDKFRFATLQSRFAAFVDLWDRGFRAREEGRPGPFSARRQELQSKANPEGRILHVTTFHDPLREMDRLQDLYESLVQARRDNGEEAVPFHKFAALVKQQVGRLRETGSREVAFRVMLKHGKVSLTARALKGVQEQSP